MSSRSKTPATSARTRRRSKSGTQYRNQPKQMSSHGGARQPCQADFPSKVQIYLAQPRVGIYDTAVKTSNSSEIVRKNQSNSSETGKKVNVTLHVTGNSKFVRKIIDKTRNCIKQAIKTNQVANQQSRVSSPRELDRLEQAQLAQKMHCEMRDRVFENHQKSAQFATESARKAQSVNELLTETLAKTKQLLSDYQQAEDNLKNSAQERLDEILAAKGILHRSESPQEVQKKEEVKPKYLSWRPQRYDQAAKPRRTISAFTARAYSASSAAAATTTGAAVVPNANSASSQRQAPSGRATQSQLKLTDLPSDFTKSGDERNKVSQLSTQSSRCSSCSRSRQGSTFHSKQVSETTTTFSSRGRKQHAYGTQYLELPNVDGHKSGTSGKKWVI